VVRYRYAFGEMLETPRGGTCGGSYPLVSEMQGIGRRDPGSGEHVCQSKTRTGHQSRASEGTDEKSRGERWCNIGFDAGNTKPAGKYVRAGQSANLIYVAVTLPSLDPSLSPTSLAEQPPSSSALLMTLCAWGSPLPPGGSAWPIVLSEQG